MTRDSVSPAASDHSYLQAGPGSWIVIFQSGTKAGDLQSLKFKPGGTGRASGAACGTYHLPHRATHCSRLERTCGWRLFGRTSITINKSGSHDFKGQIQIEVIEVWGSDNDHAGEITVSMRFRSNVPAATAHQKWAHSDRVSSNAEPE